MIFYIWVGVLLAALALYFKQVYSRFSNSGVKSKTPIPPVGNMGSTMFLLTHFVDAINDIYYDFPKEKFVGNYEFLKPIVFLRDLDLIKKITVKDFDHFVDHRPFVSEEIDPFFGRSLFLLKGQEWRDMRSTLSPAFTSSKMKHMLPFIVEIGNQMIISLKKKIQAAENNNIEIDAKDVSTRYANDVIASCAFGLKVDSISEPENEFYKMGYKSSNIGFKQFFKIFGYFIMPFVMKKLKLTLFDEEVNNFFKQLLMNTMEEREARNIVRPDMIHLLMEAKKGRLNHDEKSEKDEDAGFATVEESSVGKKSTNRVWSDDDLIAQAALFFTAGFETVSTAMSFIIYELAVNPDVQEKLLKEIRAHEVASGGKFDYNSIQTMTYMDMVVSESLRLWPPLVVYDRVCSKDYNLGRASDRATGDYIVKAGEIVNIPVMALHRDPQFFPNPAKFDPERFSNENKHKIKPFTYLPFGLGPRNCIGSRFALCEVKVMLYQLLLHFELYPSEKTPIPAQLDPSSINLKLKGGHWLRLKERK